jgi:hypothetical protein
MPRVKNPDPEYRGVNCPQGGPFLDAEVCWRIGVYEISNPKHQITNKSQIPIFNDQSIRQVSNFEFWSL